MSKVKGPRTAWATWPIFNFVKASVRSAFGDVRCHTPPGLFHFWVQGFAELPDKENHMLGWRFRFHAMRFSEHQLHGFGQLGVGLQPVGHPPHPSSSQRPFNYRPRGVSTSGHSGGVALAAGAKVSMGSAGGVGQKLFPAVKGPARKASIFGLWFRRT